MATANDTANDEAVRAEAGRIFAANTVTGEFNADDRAYLAQVVASETGLPQAEAEARVDQAKLICQECPVISACAAWALTTREPYGIWGGLSEDERARILGVRRLGGRPDHRSAGSGA